MKKKTLLYGLTTVCLITGLGFASSSYTGTEKQVAASNKEIVNESITKEVIHDRMLNSIDNFKTVKGSFTYKSNISKSDFTVDYMIKSQTNAASYNKITNNLDKSVVIKRNNGKTEIEQDENNKTYKEYGLNVSVTEHNNELKKFKDRVQTNGKGETVVKYRNDPSFMGVAGNSIFPQEIGFSFLSDYSKWEITNSEQFLGLDSVVIEGSLDEYMSAKLHSDRFKLIVEKSTGILLKAEVFNTNNEVELSIITHDIKINGPVDNTKLNSVEPPGYTKRDLFSNGKQ